MLAKLLSEPRVIIRSSSSLYLTYELYLYSKNQNVIADHQDLSKAVFSLWVCLYGIHLGSVIFFFFFALEFRLPDP